MQAWPALSVVGCYVGSYPQPLAKASCSRLQAGWQQPEAEWASLSAEDAATFRSLLAIRTEVNQVRQQPVVLQNLWDTSWCSRWNHAGRGQDRYVPDVCTADCRMSTACLLRSSKCSAAVHEGILLLCLRTLSLLCHDLVAVMLGHTDALPSALCPVRPQVLEKARVGRLLGAALEARILLFVGDDSLRARLAALDAAANGADPLRYAFIVSQVGCRACWPAGASFQHGRRLLTDIAGGSM